VQSALRDNATYIAQRKQFGRPIATFQGAALRAADAWIDGEALRAVVMQAAWRAGAGRDAAAAIAAAKWWAAQVGQRVVHTAQHLHGGIGSDLEYPVHRYFLWSKQNELLLGGASQQAARLGAWLAER
jgi:acyl-CoA dehydrogenase